MNTAPKKTMKNKTMIMLVVAICFLSIFAALATAEISNGTESHEQEKVRNLSEAKADNTGLVKVRNLSEAKADKAGLAKVRNLSETKVTNPGLAVVRNPGLAKVDNPGLAKVRNLSETKARNPGLAKVDNPGEANAPTDQDKKETSQTINKTVKQNQPNYLIYVVALGLIIVVAFLFYMKTKKK